MILRFDKYSLNEGIYDKDINDLTKVLSKLIKQNFYEDGFEYDTIFEEDIHIGKFEVELVVTLNIDTMSKFDFDIDASTDEFSMEIDITINPIMFPELLSDLIPSIKGVIRHETEHVKQSKSNIQFNAVGTSIYDYFLFDYEIPAFVEEMKVRSKYYKKPLDIIIKMFLNDYNLTEEELNNVINSWMEYSKTKKIVK